MNKWYFSENGNVTGPFSLAQAKKQASEQPSIYCWAPKFTQWQAARDIAELEVLVAEEEAQPNILTEIRQKFAIRKQRLEKKCAVIEQNVESNNALLTKLAAEIATYKKNTTNLSDSVKNAIAPLEKAYSSLSDKQAMLADAAGIAAQEIDQTVARFEAKSTGQPAKVAEEEADVEVIDINEALLEKSNQSKAQQAESRVVAEAPKQAPTQQEPAKPIPIKQEAAPATPKAEANTEEDENGNPIAGVKGLFKSVFKQETQAAPPQKSLSELLAEQESTDTAVAEDDDGAKKVRRRRRRR